RIARPPRSSCAPSSRTSRPRPPWPGRYRARASRGPGSPAHRESRDLESIEAGGGVVEELGPLRRRAVLRQALEGIPEHGVAAARLVDRKVRLENATVGTELLDGE